MNVLVLGNGFDLHYKLPTKYIDFLNTVAFLLAISEAKIDSIKTVGDVFGCSGLQDNSALIKESYEKYKDSYDATTIDKDVLIKLRTLAKVNIWFRYLHGSLNGELGWIDFEKEISMVIKCVDEFFKATKNKVYAQYKELSNTSFAVLRKFDSIFKYEVDKRAPRVFVSPNYQSEYPQGSNNMVINKSAIIEELWRQLESLADMLKIYLRHFVERVANRTYFLPLNLVQARDPGSIVTFNYTNTCSVVYPHILTKDILYIHGKTDDNIVLGVNPDECDRLGTIDTSFVKFKKYYQRVLEGTEESYLRRRREWDRKGETLNIAVVGHSLDATDKDIISELFGSAKAIQVYYHSKEAKGSLIENLVSMFGKEGFDALRFERNLEFLPMNDIIL